MAKIVVTRELSSTRGRYIGIIEGFPGKAELKFSHVNPALVVAESTFTPVSMRGQGVASALVERLIADAWSEGFKILPRCSFVAAQFESHPEWSDLRASSPVITA